MRVVVFFTGLGLVLANELARGAAPTLDHLFPIAVQAGTTNTITAVGKFDPWPARVWVDAPGVTFNAETNSGRFKVEVAANAPAGPHLIRLFNEQGASGPRFLIVTREPQLAELEPNDDFTKPQVVEGLPASLNGRLEKSGDVDTFAVKLEAGQTLIASVEAYTLASPVDALLRLLDSRGVELAFNHDDGRTLDPLLAWTAKRSGTYLLQVFGFAHPPESDIKFAGNAKCVYRLHLSGGAYVRHTLPLGVERGVSTSLQLVGWNFQQPRKVSFDGASLRADVLQTSFSPAGFDNAILLPVGDGPELMEQGLSQEAAATNTIPVPGAVTGCIATTGEEDRFRVAADKGDKFLIEVQSASLAFPLDAWLKVEDMKGKELAKNDDNAGADPNLTWTATEDGGFVIVVGNVLHRGDAKHLYRVVIQRALPTVKATVSETGFTIEPGRTNELKVTVKLLNGMKAKLVVSVNGLPDGLAAEPVEVPEKAGEVVVKLVASAEAKPFSGPIQIKVTEVDAQREYPALAELTSSTLNNGVPGGYKTLIIEATDQLWLTVSAAKAPKAESSK